MSHLGSRRSYGNRPGYQQPPQSIGQETDAFGAKVPQPHLGMDGRPISAQNPSEGMSPRDWSEAFPNSQTARRDAMPGGVNFVGPTQPQAPMPGKAAQDWAALPMGTSRVIPNTPDKPNTPMGPVTPQAMEIDPRYRTPGASPIARITSSPTAPTGGGRIVDETGDRTADFTAGGKLSSAQAPAPTRMGLTPEQGKALISAYPNLGIKGHADNLAFQQAYQQAFDPTKPMSNDDVLNVAHGLFAQRDMAKNGFSVTSTNYGAPNLAQAQKPFDAGAGITINKPSAAPYDPQPLSTGNVTMKSTVPLNPPTQIGGLVFNAPPSGMTGPGMANLSMPATQDFTAAPKPVTPSPAPQSVMSDDQKQKLLTQPLGAFGF